MHQVGGATLQAEDAYLLPLLGFGLKVFVFKLIEFTVTWLTSHTGGGKHGCFREAALEEFEERI